jgi:glycosyltransferase involved in cell wall biosynthesis
MATYNGARFIGEQLQSIAEQNCLPDELIVTDDCSSDDTLRILESFAVRVPFAVRIHRNESRLGFNRNFERALSFCTGDLVFISDQDDIWHPDKIERVSRAFESEPEMLALVHDECILDSGGRTLARTFFSNARNLGYSNRELLSGNCTALRSSFLNVLLPFPNGINYDYWIGWFADLLEARIVLEEPLQLYRRHQENASAPVLAEKDPSQWSIFLRSGLRDPRPEWAETIHGLRLVVERVKSQHEAIDKLLHAGRAQAAINQVDREIDALRQRMWLTSLPKWHRLRKILRHWREGFYEGFSGYKSVIKDLIRP